MACRPFLSMLCWSILLPVPALSQEPPPRQLPPPRHFEVHRASSAIKVNGVLDEPAWADALTFDLPFEWTPGDNTPPPVRTDFLLTYDDHNLYAAWRAYDPDPKSIRAHLMDRDNLTTVFIDDHVVLMVDPFNDERRAFQFRVNPLGGQADAIFSQNDQLEDFSYDMIWSSAARITADGYVVEVAIPLDQIRLPRTAGPQTWGFDVERSWPRNVRHRVASAPIPRGNNCVLCQTVKVTGFADLEPGRNLEIDPTVTAHRTDTLDSFPDGSLQTEDKKVDPGISMRWGVTPNVSLSATVNPDFSQVEADVAQLDVNERFALFFPEKRPFFLEGSDFFTTPVQAVFTRTVVDPDWGLKVTGKEGKNAFGAFVAADQVNSLLIPSNQGTELGFLEDSPVQSGAFRYRRDVGANSTVGALATIREGDGYHNRVAGLDSFLRFDALNTLSLQYLHSDTLYPGELERQLGHPLGAPTGSAVYADYQHNAEKWFWSLDYEDRGPGFRADSGFVPRVDIREGRGSVEHHFYGGEKDWFTQLNLGVYGQRTENHDGQLTDQVFRLYSIYLGPLQSFVQVQAERTETLVGSTLYTGLDEGHLFVRMIPSRTAFLTLGLDFGDTVDFTNNQPADLFQVNPAVELYLGRHVNARVDHTLRRLNVRGGELVEANLTQLRLIYNFSIRCFVRGIFQYLDQQQNPDLFTVPVKPEPETQTLFTQLLFSYKLNAQTVLFLGYSDNQLGLEDVSLTRTDRTFFFKVGYAWTL